MSGARPRSQPSELRWGFHRLDQRTARYVVDRAGIGDNDLVVDLGAGTGALTAALVRAGARVIAVEPRRTRRRGTTLPQSSAPPTIRAVRLRAAGDGGSDEFTREVIRRFQSDGTCWLGDTLWHGQAAMRISVSNWSTDDSDVDRSVEAILRCASAVE